MWGPVLSPVTSDLVFNSCAIIGGENPGHGDGNSLIQGHTAGQILGPLIHYSPENCFPELGLSFPDSETDVAWEGGTQTVAEALFLTQI